MADKVKPVPDGYHTATPYLIVKGAAKAIEFYKQAFGATEVERMEMPDGKIAHAEIKIGDSIIMLGDEAPQHGTRGPKSLGGSPCGLYLYVEDVDQTFNRAITAGATATMAVKDQFYGDRNGSLVDPFGHTWYVATRKENLSMDEIRQRLPAA
ncbi:MAG: VOC family protein [Candidatus Korobacteraceae bacterium]|jgi:PhnB protein